MDEASWIQFSYPDSGLAWSTVAEDTLLQLVKEHEEPNCASANSLKLKNYACC